ncbi:MAG: phosphate/phosphite/phosphonate ABC transporter substrate-binding protein [Sphaerospermopsis sp. SIO1G2]|nr:phosphate/phosphite/phosphonate ABC transporter substrate-binding protein [Sphaerospermopsis sp. SIO1G1]NET74157.1 phosphate/phosphite/phosphonate ABC transporter substrate-binding protein [Sphaerospermopsis sp. SIO1G2]
MTHHQWKSSCYSSQKIRVLLVILLTIITFCTGCSQQRNQDLNGSSSLPPNYALNQKSQKITIAVISNQASANKLDQLPNLAKYLESNLSHQFEIKVYPDYETVVELLVNEKVQIAYLTSFSYIKAKEKNPNLEPILAPISKKTGRPWHTSIIIANANKIKSIQDLNNKRFGFVSKSSTTGYLIPAIEFFLAREINPEQVFQEVKFLGSHEQAITALISGKVDAVATSLESIEGEKFAQQLQSLMYAKIWESSPSPTDPIVVSTTIQPILVNGIKKVLLDAPKEIISISGVEISGYTIVDDLNYERIRKMQQQLEEINQNQNNSI